MTRSVLSVGGSSREIPLPLQYDGWEVFVLDIDATREPDIVCDARELTRLPAGLYDAVYCSHNLEHYFEHDVPRVLAGFVHVLKPSGFAHIRVPDMGALMRAVAEKNMDIDDVLYESPAGPIRVKDVIYGYATEIERSGSDFFAHKTGFTRQSLKKTLLECGFPYVFVTDADLEIVALGFRGRPEAYATALFGLPAVD